MRAVLDIGRPNSCLSPLPSSPPLSSDRPVASPDDPGGGEGAEGECPEAGLRVAGSDVPPPNRRQRAVSDPGYMVPRHLHEIHETKLPCGSRIELISSKLSFLSAHVTLSSSIVALCSETPRPTDRPVARSVSTDWNYTTAYNLPRGITLWLVI